MGFQWIYFSILALITLQAWKSFCSALGTTIHNQMASLNELIIALSLLYSVYTPYPSPWTLLQFQHQHPGQKNVVLTWPSTSSEVNLASLWSRKDLYSYCCRTKVTCIFGTPSYLPYFLAEACCLVVSVIGVFCSQVHTMDHSHGSLCLLLDSSRTPSNSTVQDTSSQGKTWSRQAKVL